MSRVWTCLTSVGSCLVVVVAVWGMLAFPGSAVADPPPHNHGGGDGDDGKSKPADIPVNVTFRDCVGGNPTGGWMGAGCGAAEPNDRIQSDLGGAYMDGQDVVTATIFRAKKRGDGGTFNLKTHKDGKKTERAGPRSVFFDFSDLFQCTVPGVECSFPPSLQDGLSQASIGVRGGQVVPNGMLGLGDGDSALMALSINILLSESGGWFLNFDPNREGCGMSKRVLVERTSETTWDITSPENGIGCLEKIIDGDGPAFYTMPFALTVEAQ